jgi:hypothetical protein
LPVAGCMGIGAYSEECRDRECGEEPDRWRYRTSTAVPC